MSLRKGIEHGPATIALGPAVRLPVLPRSRTYLKALREAELAAWETAKPLTDISAKARRAPARLPSPERYAGESRLLISLGVLCVLTLGYEFQSLLQSAGNWHNFVEFVRIFLT